MPAQTMPLTIEQGATFMLAFEWRYDSEVEPGTPGDLVDLTGAQIRMQIRKNQQQPALVDASSAGTDPFITHNGAGGRVTVKLPASATNLLTTKSALYDLEVEMPDGDVHRLLEGQVTVKPNITQLPDEPVVGQ